MLISNRVMIDMGDNIAMKIFNILTVLLLVVSFSCKDTTNRTKSSKLKQPLE